jgi:DNA mismatch endonuclease (patch repair protein)
MELWTSAKDVRSRMMAAVHAKNTRLELAFRSRLHDLGLRFRLHRKDLPGTPDIVLPRYSAVFFVHGCFWHQHGCQFSKLPSTRRRWWRAKLEGNRRRDERATYELLQQGWRVLTLWECSVRRPGIDREKALDRLAKRATAFLTSSSRRIEIPVRPRKPLASRRVMRR